MDLFHLFIELLNDEQLKNVLLKLFIIRNILIGFDVKWIFYHIYTIQMFHIYMMLMKQIKCLLLFSISMYQYSIIESENLFFCSSLHGNDLLDNLLNRRTYTERDAALIIRNLVETLKHLHSRNIAHLDIKVIFNLLI